MKVIVTSATGEDEEFEGDKLEVKLETVGNDICVLTIKKNYKIIAQFVDWAYWRIAEEEDE